MRLLSVKLDLGADGRTTSVTLRVGMPSRRPGGEWACAIDADGLASALAPIQGADALHAVLLAARVLKDILRAELEKGATLHLEGEPVSLDGLFPPL